MSACGEYYDGQEHARIDYRRDGNVVTVSLRGMTNHEMRDFIVGMWLRLADDDKRDHIKALQHYLEPGAMPPYVSRTIAEATDQPQMRRRPS